MHDTELDALDSDQDSDSSIKRRVTVSRFDPLTGTYSNIYYPDFYPVLYPNRFYG